jgi:hypothetical protein
MALPKTIGQTQIFKIKYFSKIKIHKKEKVSKWAK